MAVETVTELVKELVELEATFPVRLSQPDREDTTCITFRAVEGQRDPLLAGGNSGLEFWRYIVSVRGNDGAAVEAESRTVQDALDALAINYTVDTFVVQSAMTGSLSDEDTDELVSDQFEYQYSFTLSLAIGRTE